MSVLARYLRGAGVLTTLAVVQRLVGALTSIILARGLGATGFGAYSAVVNTASSAYGIVKLGVDAAVHVYAAKGRDDAKAGQLTGELFGAGLGILATAGFVAAVATAASAEWLAAAVFGQPALAGLLRFAGVLTALQCLSQFSYAVLAGFQEFGVYARLMTVNAGLMLTLTAGGMWFYGVDGALGGYGVAQVILAVSLGHAAARALREHGVRIAYSRLSRAVASLMRLGIPFYASGLVVVPVTFYLQGLLSRSAGVDALGLLRVIATITAAIAFIPGSVAAVTTSTLTRARADAGVPDSKFFDYAFLHLKVVWYLTTVTAITLLILAPVLVKTLFGVEYAAAIEPGMVALFSTVFSSTAAAAGSLFFAMERSSILFWQSVLQSLVLAIAGLLVIPAMGVLGYVGSELAGNLVGLSFVLFVAVRMSSGNRFVGRLLIMGVLAALGSFSAAMLVILEANIVPRIVGLVATVVVMTTGAILFGVTHWELSVIQRAFSTKGRG